ncbi:MAG: zinc-ribbon domain-containing protein [Candidatus Hodarchaeota archaeon]
MFCQNCGAQLEMENQRFCQNCGSEILDTSQPTKTTMTMDQDKTIEAPIPVPQYTTSFKKGEPPGSFSKRCLGFGVVSLIIGVITFNIGTTFVTGPFLYYYVPVGRIFIGLAIVHVAGIIFGILSRVNSGKAKGLEPETTALKAGSALGIIGLVINSILLVAALVLIP